jgi:DNA ligase-1
MAETIALLLPTADGVSITLGLRTTVQKRLLPLLGEDETSLRDSILRTWREMDYRQRLVWNKMITGDLRAGISRQTIIRALAEFAGMEAAVISHRLMGAWEPTGKFFRRLLSPESGEADSAVTSS